MSLTLAGAMFVAGFVVGDVLEPVDPPPDLPTAPPRSVSLTLSAGIHRQPSPEMDAVYSTAFPLEVEFRAAGWFGERFGVGIVAGVQRRDGEGIAPTEPLPTTVLWQIPLAVEGGLRLALQDGQVFVPTMRAGLGVVVALENWEVADLTDPEAEEPVSSGSWRGVKGAVHFAGGFQVRIPFPELSFRGPSFGPPGIQDLYLSVEGRLRSAADFGRGGLDLSGAGVFVGLTFLL
jgi:hypothetical protein